MITVLAGVNGAGKSSIGGAFLKQRDGSYFNPDEYAAELMAADGSLDFGTASIRAWQVGFDLLKRAVDDDLDHAFETTLGGHSITEALLDACRRGRKVRLWLCGLESAELHIARVKARAARGGHDIPEAKIRARFDASRHNMVRLILAGVDAHLYDNSRPLSPDGQPQLRHLLAIENGAICFMHAQIPEWAKPLAAVAMSTSGRRPDGSEG